MIRRTVMASWVCFALGCADSTPIGSGAAPADPADVIVAAFESVDEKSPEVRKLVAPNTYRLTPATSRNQTIYSWMFDEGYLDELGAERHLLVAMDSVAHLEPAPLGPDVFTRLGVDHYLGPESSQVVETSYRFTLAEDSTLVHLISFGTPLIRGAEALVDFSFRCDPVLCWERGLVLLRHVGDEWVPVGRVTYVYS
jgi:hypothetical protein